MEVRQKWRSLTLCFLMLMTLLPSGSITARAAETLFKADDGVFQNNIYNFDEDSYASLITGKSTSDTAYKYVSEYDGEYFYYVNSMCSTDDLSEALDSADVVKKGDRVAIQTNLSGESTYEDFISKLSSYKTYVYTENDELKYTITHDKFSDYASNTSISHDFSITRGSAITDSAGNILGYTYNVSNNHVSYMSLDNDDCSYDIVVEDSKFNFTGANATWDYYVVLSDGYTVTGQLKQDGVFTGMSVDELDYSDVGDTPVSQNPTLTLSKIPTKKCDSFELTITSDINAQIWFNGEGSEEYSKNAKFTVEENGVFYYSATTKDGGYTEGTVEVKCISTGSDADEEKWEPVDWSGSSDSSGNPNIVQTGIFSEVKTFRYIGAILVLLGFGILGIKKKGTISKKGGSCE